MNFLELVGHALHIIAFPELVAGRTICTKIDNHGSTVIARKGRDLRCPVTDCLVRTCSYVATALQCRAFVGDITRCSSLAAKSVDAISKSQWDRFHELMPGHAIEPRRIPPSFAKWLDNPVDDMFLGTRIVADLKKWGIETLY